MKKQELLSVLKKIWVQQDIIEKILMKKTGLTKSQFFLADELDISNNDLEEIKNLLKKIAFWYPIEYALEKAEFYWLDFYVDKRCLIPRDDTEVMVEKAIEEIKKTSPLAPLLRGEGNVIYIDVWTGSWAIPISIVDNVWQYIGKAFAVDISDDALEVAGKNIKTHNLENKIELLKSDLLSKIFPLLTREQVMDWVITANLPYIKNEDFWNMDQEVILHEPSIALYWWKDTWFELYEKLIFQCFELKSIYNIKNLTLFIEIWFDQKQVAIKFLENKKLDFEIFKDNWGVDRCVKIEF